jgi:hypothetical protein
MHRTVDARAHRIQCDLEARPHRGRELPAAMQLATWGCSAQIARRLNLSQRLVEAWGNPNDPNRSPVEALRELMEEALHHHAAVDALAPLTALADCFGFDLVQRKQATATDSDVIDAAASALREAGEAVAVALETISEGHSEVALAKSKREIQEAIDALYRLLREKEAAAATGQRSTLAR